MTSHLTGYHRSVELSLLYLWNGMPDSGYIFRAHLGVFVHNVDMQLTPTAPYKLTLPQAIHLHFVPKALK